MSYPSLGSCFQLKELMSVPLRGSNPARLPPTHFVHKHWETEWTRPESTVGSSHKRECLEDSLWLIYTTSCQSQGQHVLQTASPVFLLLLKGTEECVSRKKSDISGALSSLPHLKRIYYCNQLHFLITFSFKVIWENLLKSKFWKAPLWTIPSHPMTSGNVKWCWWAPLADKLQVKDHWPCGLGTGLGLNLPVPSAWPHYNLLGRTGFSRPEAPIRKTRMILPHVTRVSWG